MSKGDARKFAVGAAVAGVAGYVAGILTAPKSGKETRADIKHAAHEGIAEAEKQLKKLHTQLSTLLTQAKDEAQVLRGKGGEGYDAAVEKAKVVREKAREVLSAVHEGKAEDKDLKKAINDANKAIDHLKTYLKKA